MAVVDLEYETWGRSLPVTRAIDLLPTEALEAETILLRSIRQGDLEREGTSLSQLETQVLERNSHPRRLGLLFPNVDDSGRHSMRLQWTSDPDERTEAAILANARAVELAGRMLRSDAIHRAHGAHFVLPSGSHASHFIRLADVLRGGLVVERIVDWIAPSVVRGAVIIFDSWTITAVEIELRRRFATGDLRTFTHDQYPSDRHHQQLLDLIASAVAGKDSPRVVAVLSVVSSGEMLAKTQLVLDGLSPATGYSILALANTTRASLGVECFVSIPSIEQFRVQDGASCALCRDGDRRELIEIDRSKYTPKVSGRTHLQMLTANAAQQHRKLWEACSETDAAAVHRYDPVTKRHLHVSFDITRLLRHDRFRRDALARLRQVLSQCDLVLVPEHQATDALMELGREAFPSAVTLSFPRELEDEAALDRLRPALKGVRRILVLDDVLIRGFMMRRVHRSLQDLVLQLRSEDRPHSGYQIVGAVILARPEYESVLKGVEQSFHQNRPDSFFAIHTVIAPGLPCAWCEEERLLEQAEEWTEVSDNVKRVARMRLARLRSAGTEGIRLGLAMCDRNGNIDQRQNERITLNSLFGEELIEAVAYCAVACTLNQIRDQTNARGFDRNGSGWAWDVTRVVSAYHDPLLQMSFLRASIKRELMVPSGRGVRKAIATVLKASEREHPARFQSLAAEHAMAVFLGKHSDLRQSEVLRTAVSSLSESGNRDIVDFLRAAAFRMLGIRT